MEQHGEERWLTAILSADVVGYGGLMGEDEEGTLNTLKEYSEVTDGTVSTHSFGSAGDSSDH